MHKQLRRILALILLFSLSLNRTLAQQKDSILVTSSFSGSLGVTNNGLSIIPIFALNAPAINVLLSVKKNRFSFDPDIRLTFDGKKGGMIFWFRYRPVQGKRFNLQLGAHPAYNLALREIVSNSNSPSTTITQARRFIAAEIFPSIKIAPKIGMGFYFLNGFGMQLDGPQDTKFIAFNMNFSTIPIFKNHFIQYIPQLYYLEIDRENGTYYTHTISLSGKNHPFTLQSVINKEIRTNISGSTNLAWNISLFYTFNNKYARKMGQTVNLIQDRITNF